MSDSGRLTSDQQAAADRAEERREARDWRKIWQPKLRGGNEVLAVFDNPGNDDMLVVFRGIHGRCNSTNVLRNGMFVKGEESSMDLVPVKREPVLRDWTWAELGQHSGFHFRPKNGGAWVKIIGVLADEREIRFEGFPRRGLGDIRNFWVCCANPFAETPTIEDCGVLA